MWHARDNLGFHNDKICGANKQGNHYLCIYGKSNPSELLVKTDMLQNFPFLVTNEFVY